MVRSVVFPYIAQSQEEFEQLSKACEVLGFHCPEGWDDECSRGKPFLAPIGGLEIVNGQPPAEADLLVEVEDVQKAASILAEKGIVVEPITDTHWNARIAIAQLRRLRVGFFSYKEPQA